MGWFTVCFNSSKQAAGWCTVLCRQEFKLLLLINKLTGVPVRTAVVTARHGWRLQGTFLPQSIYCASRCCAAWNRLYSKNALIDSYCITKCLLQSLFLVKLLLEKKCNCLSVSAIWIIIVFYCVMVDFTVSYFIWMPLSLKVRSSSTDWMVSKFKQIRSN